MTVAEHQLRSYIVALQDGRFDDAARIANDCHRALEAAQRREFDAAAEAALTLLREEFFNDLDAAEEPAARMA